MVDIILTIFAWRRGWKAWALLPMGITFIIAIIIGLSGGGLGIVMILVAIEVIALITMIIVKPKKRTPAKIESLNMYSPASPVASEPINQPVKDSNPIIQPAAPIAEPASQSVVESVPVIQPAIPAATPVNQPILEPVGEPVEPVTTLARANEAKLVLPDNNEIAVKYPANLLGRKDFEKYVSPENLQYISRRHFTVNTDGSRYYIEDQNSSNSTKVNSVNIKGLGWQELKNGDRIDLADAVTMTFVVCGVS